MNIGYFEQMDLAHRTFDVIDDTKKFKISGIVDNDESILNCLNYPLIGKDKDLKSLREKYEFAFIEF